MRIKQATARVIMAHVTGRDPGAADHFAGLESALLARGITVDRVFPGQCTPRLTSATRVVLVPNAESSVCRYLIREAKRVGAVSVLLMDGIVEWRNTFVNPRGGEAFLRPAPVDLVACAGEIDRRVLEALGNAAVATGLPRLARFQGRWRDEAGRVLDDRAGRTVLIATAKTPAFSDAERDVLVEMLRRWRDAAAGMNVRVVWRLGGGLDAVLGVLNDGRPLASVLGECDAACTTASTLMVEAMMAGVPTAVLHPYGTPLFQPAAWAHVWEGDGATGCGARSGKRCGTGCGTRCGRKCGTSGAGRMANVSEKVGHELLHIADQAGSRTRRVAEARELLAAMLSPTGEDMARQADALASLHQPAGETVARLAQVIEEAIQQPRHSPRAGVFACRDVPSCITPVRADAKRVVFVVKCENGIEGRSLRWCRAAAVRLNRSRGAFEACVLAFTTGHDYWDSVGERPPNDEVVRTVVLEPFEDVIARMRRVDTSLAELGPSIVVACDRDFAHAAALRARDAARYEGRRVAYVVLPAADTAGDRGFAEHYGEWDGALAMDDAVGAWLGPMARERGVPFASVPDDGVFTEDAAGDDAGGRVARFFEQIWAAERVHVPSIAGLTLIEPCHQSAPAPIDRESAREWLWEQLTVAGFVSAPASQGEGSISSGGTTARFVRVIDDDDAIDLSRSCDGGVLASAGARTPGTGPGVVFPSLMTVSAAADRDRCDALIRERLRELVRRGFRRIVVYGTGQHFFRHAGVFDEGFPIVGIIDDAAIAWPSMFGVPVVQTRDALTLAPDAVLLFSDAWERVMWENSAFLRRTGVHVAPIYNTFSDDLDRCSVPVLQTSHAS